MPRYVLLYEEPRRYEQFRLVLDVQDELLTKIVEEFPIHAYLDLVTTHDPMPRSPEVIPFYWRGGARSRVKINPTHVLLSPASEYRQVEIDNTYGPILKVEKDLTDGVIGKRELLLSNNLYLDAMHDRVTVQDNYAKNNNSLYHGLRRAFLNIDSGISPSKY